MSEKKEFKPLDVGASERVPWKIAKGLAKNIGFKDDGSVEVGKNLEVDGQIKLNSGFTAIHTFTLREDDDNNLTVDVYWESAMDLSKEQTANIYSFSGRAYGTKNGNSMDLQVLGMYVLQNGELFMLNVMSQYILGPVFLSWSDGEFTSFSYIDTQDFPNYLSANLKTIFGNQSLVGEGNIDLYEHHLLLGGNGYKLVLVKQSSNNLKCDSIQDLRTLLKAGSETQFYPVIYSTQTGATATEAYAGYLKVSSSICQIGTYPDGIGTVADITTVSDTVTTI